MTRLIGMTALLLTGLFALLLGGLGLQAQDDPQAYFGDCRMPCWKGIEPGVTSGSDALARLTRVNQSAPVKSPCSNPPTGACDRYTWLGAENQALYTELDIQPDRFTAIIAYSPGITLGDLLTTLDSLHVDFYGAYTSRPSGNRFFFHLLFDDARLIVYSSAPCPGTYRALLEAPVGTLTVRSPDQSLRTMVTSFRGLLRTFYQVCALQ